MDNKKGIVDVCAYAVSVDTCSVVVKISVCLFNRLSK